MLNTYERHSKMKLTATILTILVIAGVVLMADHIKAQNAVNKTALARTTNTTTSAPTTSTAPTAPTTTNATNNGTTTNTGSSYKDGTYSATSNYSVPHGEESIQVSLTLQNGVVTDSSVKNSEYDFTSAQYQESFASQYKSFVIGQKISNLQLDVISGASDTSRGFDEAVSQIASKAQA